MSERRYCSFGAEVDFVKNHEASVEVHGNVATVKFLPKIGDTPQGRVKVEKYIHFHLARMRQQPVTTIRFL